MRTLEMPVVRAVVDLFSRKQNLTKMQHDLVVKMFCTTEVDFRMYYPYSKRKKLMAKGHADACRFSGSWHTGIMNTITQ